MQFSFKTAVFAGAVSLLGTLLPLTAPAVAAEYSGTPALVSSHDVRAKLGLAGSGLARQLTIREFSEDKAAPLRAFDLDMTKRMHLIVVGDDFGFFSHVHPVLGADGAFRLALHFPRTGFYHLYADALPTGYGHSVFRFDVPLNAVPSAALARRIGAIRDFAAVGPYVVRLSTTRVPAGVDTPVLAAITKGGESATDLHPYLGAFAHIVALGFRDLSYTHVHAMDARAMSGMDMHAGGGSPMPADAIVPATMSVHLNLPHRGTYKVWIEFNGGGTLRVAPFMVTAY